MEAMGAVPAFGFRHSYAEELEGCSIPWRPDRAPAPRLLRLNRDLAAELGLDVEALDGPLGAAVFSGSVLPADARPVAQAYAGHQFGGFSPRLGDGRAVLLGELKDRAGRTVDLALKGSGATPFARRGDGKAAVGPVLREYLMGEAMAALGVPTTRALAAVATGAPVWRETELPGAVLARVAASHIRVGTFQFLAARGEGDRLRRLLDHAIARHHPQAAEAAVPALAFLQAVAEAQARLVAQWMGLGFVHGVMNTDNMAVSGETIDYGPCAFMEGYAPGTVFSSIDRTGRYAYGNQPGIAQWNLTRLAETLLPLIDADEGRAIAAARGVLEGFGPAYFVAWEGVMRAKLGLAQAGPDDRALAEALLSALEGQGADWTMTFRALAPAALGDRGPLRVLLREPRALEAWLDRWQARLATEGRPPEAVAAAIRAANPAVIPRNLAVEEALAAATAGDLAPFEALLGAVTRPFDPRPGQERYLLPDPGGLAGYRTYCGT